MNDEREARPNSSADSDTMSIADAAAECDMTVAEFLEQMVSDGLLMRDEDGDLMPGLHPALRPITPFDR